MNTLFDSFIEFRIRFNLIAKLFSWLAFVALISACSSMSKHQCQTTDWEEQGLVDGREGIPFEIQERRKTSCNKHEVSVDHEAYLRGREAGLKSFCTTSHFFFAGEMGYYARPELCAGDQKSSLVSQFQEGRKIYDLGKRKEALKNKKAEFEKDKSVVADVARVTALLQGTSPTASQDREIAEIDRQIASIQATAPDAAEYCEFEMKRKAIARNIIPGFLLRMSPEADASLQICSRDIPPSTTAK